MIDEAGASQMLVELKKRKKTITQKEIEAVISTIARIPPKSVSVDDKAALATLEADLKRVVFGQDKAIERVASAIKLGARGVARCGQADRQLSVQRADGRGQDRGRQAVGAYPGHPANPLRYVANTWSATRVSRLIGAPSGLCRFRSGRAADRCGRPASAQRAAAGRDREGASRSVQHPAAGDG